jgi:hypothetical protein
VLVRASQNLTAFASDGTLRYERKYQAPGLSFGDKLLRVAASSAMTAASYYAARASAQTAANTAAYFNGGSATIWYTYNMYMPQLADRQPASKAAERFVYMYTEDQANEFDLVQIDKTNGQETGRLRLKDRRPTYAPHPSLPLVMVTNSGSEITAYDFGRR